MTEALLPTTGVTLLDRLRCEPAGWDEFVERYGRHIYRWCRQWHLQDADAEDLTQIILLKLFRVLPEFSYDPSRSFRGWLKTVAYRAWWDYRNRGRVPDAPGGPDADPRILSLEAREDLARKLEEAFDLELLETAQARVRERVAPHTWEAFRLTAHECMSAADVAARLGQPVAVVYVARRKVQKLLQDEVARLEGSGS